MSTDLTPTEARAEVEAFMGEGWSATAWESDIVRGMFVVKAQRGDIVVGAMKDTYRAAVSALKAAWRDAVRPWCERSALRYHHDRHAIHDAYKLRGEVFDARQFVRSHVLKESDHE